MEERPEGGASARVSRKTFLKVGAFAAASLALPGAARGAGAQTAAPFALEEATISGLGEVLAAGQVTSSDLVALYLDHVALYDDAGPTIRSVLEINPDAYEIAAALDEERTAGNVRGPLHGVPVLVKDNIDTADAMQTAAGSLVLAGYFAPCDATVAARLRGAGAILLGKTNLSERANFRSTQSSSGWSSRGGQGLNPYALDRSACGSSSGSAAAVAANLCAAALGTETDGSIVCPSAACSIVGVKPTVGLTSRAGVIPISRTQDTVGAMARTDAAAAVVLGAIAGGPDPRDLVTKDSRVEAGYTRFLDPNGLRGHASGSRATRTSATATRPTSSRGQPSRRCCGSGRWS